MARTPPPLPPSGMFDPEPLSRSERAMMAVVIAVLVLALVSLVVGAAWA